MRRLAPTLALCAAFMPGTAPAVTLEFPAMASVTAEQLSDHDSHRLAISGFHDGTIDRILAEGVLHQKCWRVASSGLTTLQLLAPLRTQLEEAGFSVLFECADEGCGGFDFRFETEVMPEPAMHVDLGDFRYLAARRMDEGTPEYVSLLVSRSSQAGFVQMTRIGPPDATLGLAASTKAPEPEVMPAAPGLDPGPGLVDRLVQDGRVTLSDLDFRTGSAELGEGSFGSLSALAAWLNEAPERRVFLVGHTDAEGALETNIALSRRRAAAVTARLVESHGVRPGQIASEGVGFLAPVASNATEEGRQQNRRVEAVLAGPE